MIIFLQILTIICIFGLYFEIKHRPRIKKDFSGLFLEYIYYTYNAQWEKYIPHFKRKYIRRTKNYSK